MDPLIYDTAPHLGTLDAHYRRRVRDICGVTVHVQPVTAGEPIETPSAFVCTNRVPCPRHPLSDADGLFLNA